MNINRTASLIPSDRNGTHSSYTKISSNFNLYSQTPTANKPMSSSISLLTNNTSTIQPNVNKPEHTNDDASKVEMVENKENLFPSKAVKIHNSNQKSPLVVPCKEEDSENFVITPPSINIDDLLDHNKMDSNEFRNELIYSSISETNDYSPKPSNYIKPVDSNANTNCENKFINIQKTLFDSRSRYINSDSSQSNVGSKRKIIEVATSSKKTSNSKKAIKVALITSFFQAKD